MNAIEKKALVEKMKVQHAQLARDLEELRVLAFAQSGDVDVFKSKLRKFKVNLEAHWHLEDHTFYVEYINMKRARNQNTDRITTYIKEMQVISKAVRMSVDTYLAKDASGEDAIKVFVPQLKRITEILQVRIETEEERPYVDFLKE